MRFETEQNVRVNLTVFLKMIPLSKQAKGRGRGELIPI